MTNKRITFQMSRLHCDCDFFVLMTPGISTLTYLLTLGPANRLYSQLSKLIVLLLVIPATSATAERSFSCVRTAQTQDVSARHHESTETNHLLVVHVHQDLTDSLARPEGYRIGLCFCE